MQHKVGFLGLGLMGTRMAKAMAAQGRFVPLVALDADPERTQTWCSEFGAVPTKSATELIHHPEVDLIYIATPPNSHVPFAIEAIRAGKAVLVEKPLATDIAQAEELRFVVLSEKGRCWMHFPFATLPGLARMRRDLQSGATGEVESVEVILRFSQWPRTWHNAGPWLSGGSEGGFCREVFSHFAYLTQELLDPLGCLTRKVKWSPAGTEVRVEAELAAGGVPVTLHASIDSELPDYNRWTLVGSEQSYRVEDWSNVSIYQGQMGLNSISADRNWIAHELEPGEDPGLASTLEGLHRAMLDQTHPLPDVQAGLQVMRAVEALVVKP